MITGSIIAAADPRGNDTALAVDVVVVLSLLIFWMAHVYASVLGNWAENGEAPTVGIWRRTMRHEWPIVGGGMVPALVLLVGVVGLVSDTVAVNIALSLCTAELGAAGFFAARAGGGGLIAASISAAVAVGFGLVLILMKAVVH